MTYAARYAGLYAYPWDVAEQSPERFVAALAEWRIDTLCLASAYHAGKFIRPHGAAGRVMFPEDGTVYFRARTERYGAIRPRVAAMVDGADMFAAYAGRPGIAVTAWTVLLHNSRLGLEHPGAVARNLFGDPYRYSLCPAHPDVADYAVNLCADLADLHDLRGLVLETPGWLPYAHGYHHEFALIGPNPWLDAQLGLCFCDHCRTGAARAGIDVDGLRRRLCARVDGYLAAPADTAPALGQRWLESDLVSDPALGAFLRWRCTVVTALVARIRAAVRPAVELFIIPSIRRPSAAGWIEGSDLPALAAAADGLEVCLYEPSPADVLADYGEIRRRAGPDARIRCVLRPGPPDNPAEPSFAQTVAGLRARGAEGFGFYNYGHVRRANLDWIGRALGQGVEKDPDHVSL